MRTTITLDPDTRLLVERAMRERGVSFKQAVNEAIRSGLAPAKRRREFTTTRALGEPRVDLTKALGLADRMEDERRARRLRENG